MWKPHKSDTETIQIEILGIAELEISKKLVMSVILHGM